MMKYVNSMTLCFDCLLYRFYHSTATCHNQLFSTKNHELSTAVSNDMKLTSLT